VPHGEPAEGIQGLQPLSMTQVGTDPSLLDIPVEPLTEEGPKRMRERTST